MGKSSLTRVTTRRQKKKERKEISNAKIEMNYIIALTRAEKHLLFIYHRSRPVTYR